MCKKQKTKQLKYATVTTQKLRRTDISITTFISVTGKSQVQQQSMEMLQMFSKQKPVLDCTESHNAAKAVLR